MMAAAGLSGAYLAIIMSKSVMIEYRVLASSPFFLMAPSETRSYPCKPSKKFGDPGRT